MKVIFDNEKREQQEIEVRKITIPINSDVDYEIRVNNFGELVLQKHQYGPGTSSIEIKPNVSNEIRCS